MAPLLAVKDPHVEFTTRDGRVKAVNGVTLRSLVRLLPKARTQIVGEVWLRGMKLYQLPEDDVQNLRGSLVAMIFQEPMMAAAAILSLRGQRGHATAGMARCLPLETLPTTAEAMNRLHSKGGKDGAV
jgi:peptide/nickel transport system ATP-binding protein